MSNQNISGKRVIVTTAKSMHKIKPEQVQLLLVDEAHNFGWNAYGFELMKFCFCRRFGFTATPVRNQGDLKFFQALFGPTLQKIDFQETLRQGMVTGISYVMLPACRKLDYLSKLKGAQDFIKQKLYYVYNTARNQLIISVFKEIQQACPEAQILIMTQSLAHLILLAERLPECLFAHGERSGLDRFINKKAMKNIFIRKYEQTVKQLNWVKKQFETGDAKYAISTGVWKQGITLSHLAVLIRADGAVSEIPSVQIPGRLSRLSVEKPQAFLVDFQDEFCPEMEKRAEKREKVYQLQGWKHIEFSELLEELRRRKNNEKSRVEAKKDL